MTRLALIALMVASWSLYYAVLQRHIVDDLRQDNADMREALVRVQEAEATARVQAALERHRAQQLAEAVEEIHGGPDAPLPDHIRAVLDSLRTD